MKRSVPLFLLVIVIARIGLSGQETENKDTLPLTAAEKQNLIEIAQEGVTDIDGNHYNAMLIGRQIWITENLKASKLNDGTDIPLVTDNMGWDTLKSPAYCWYDNNPENGRFLGAIYNGHAVATGKLCPEGWHVPTDSEWLKLTKVMGGVLTAGAALKRGAEKFWDEPDFPSNGNSFMAMPGGLRWKGGIFEEKDKTGFWWTSSAIWGSSLYYRKLLPFEEQIFEGWGFPKNYGISTRCIND